MGATGLFDSLSEMKALLLAEDARTEFKVPARGRAKRRPPIAED